MGQSNNQSRVIIVVTCTLSLSLSTQSGVINPNKSAIIMVLATTFMLTCSEHIVYILASQKYKFFQWYGSKVRNNCTDKSTTTTVWIKGSQTPPARWCQPVFPFQNLFTTPFTAVIECGQIVIRLANWVVVLVCTSWKLIIIIS